MHLCQCSFLSITVPIDDIYILFYVVTLLNYQMAFSIINALIMLFNISLKVLHFDNISLLLTVCKLEIVVNVHCVCI